MTLLCPHCNKEIPQTDLDACPHCQGLLVVNNKYRLVGYLGGGGMGAVYLARDKDSGAQVAAKLLKVGGGADWKGHELFERSSKVLMSLSHKGLPKIYDLAEDFGGKLCLIREEFSGGTLEDRVLKERRHLSPEDLRHLMTELLQLLSYLHSRMPAVLHRDIKPSNIMFRSPEDNEPVLVDFDTVAAPGGQEQRVTIVGTPGYTAPEQFAGAASPSSDLFSLGATLLFVATHTHPDELPRVDGRFQVERLLQKLDPRAKAVLLKLLEPEKKDRYQDASEALQDLNERPSKARAKQAAELACDACGKKNPSHYKFCLGCGGALGEQPAQPQPVRLAAPRPVANSKPNKLAVLLPTIGVVIFSLVASFLFLSPKPKTTKTSFMNGSEPPTALPKKSALTCEAPTADCDGLAENGCEARLDAADTCGRCNNACKAGESCVSGACLSAEKKADAYAGQACMDFLPCYDELDIFGAIAGRITAKIDDKGVVSSIDYKSGQGESAQSNKALKGCFTKAMKGRQIQDFEGGAGVATCEYSGTYSQGMQMLSQSWSFKRE